MRPSVYGRRRGSRAYGRCGGDGKDGTQERVLVSDGDKLIAVDVADKVVEAMALADINRDPVATKLADEAAVAEDTALAGNTGVYEDAVVSVTVDVEESRAYRRGGGD
jgi:hypothetical protein